MDHSGKKQPVCMSNILVNAEQSSQNMYVFFTQVGVTPYLVPCSVSIQQLQERAEWHL